jgi:tRNA modification GTPase
VSVAALATLVAAATPPGRGGIGIVRVSGPRSSEFAEALIGQLPKARHATLARFLDAAGEPIDAGIALYFPAPNSYTGEDVLELHGHGGPVIVEALVARLVELGAERAGPGEFTRRAFENGKIDLTQAEAVADLIDAGSRAAARAAMRSLQGDFRARIDALRDALIELRAYIEATIDFPEEEIDFQSDLAVLDRLESVRAEFLSIEGSARSGVVLRDGLTVVLAGRPNAGKSSLLNRLAGYDAAMVSPLPGTTRDLVREQLDLDGLPLQVLDTAGLRPPADALEAVGIRRARAAIGRADRVLFVIDALADPDATAYEEERANLPADLPVTLVFNKSDLVSGPVAPPARIEALAVSAHTGAGLEALRAHLKAVAGFESVDSGTVSARARHLEALRRAHAHLEEGARQLKDRHAAELVAEELRLCQQALAEITGEFTTEDLLGRIFSSFCIGK